MNKIYSKFLLSTCVVMALGLTACNSDDDMVVVGPASSGAYFPNNSPSDYDVEPDETGFNLYLMRTDSASAQTVQLTIADESGFFSAPASVSFEAGRNTAVLPLSFDASKFEPKDYQVTIAVADADSYLYGMHEYTFTVGLADSYRWVTIGKCQYNDSFLFDEFYECDLQQHALDKNSYRVKSPYLEALRAEGVPESGLDPSQCSEYITFDILSPGQKVYGTTITTNDLVVFDDIYTGYWLSNYSDVVAALFPGRFTSLSKESDWAYNCVKSYQEDGTPNVVQFAPYYFVFSANGGWNNTQINDMIRIIFPGGRLMDASAQVKILSVDLDNDPENVIVDADIILGADVTEARVGIVNGTDAETGNFMITHDRADYITITSSGKVSLKLPKDSTPGMYSVIASTYVGGKATEYDYATFSYVPGGDDEWTMLGNGTYTYSQFWEGDDEGLGLYRNNEDPTLYKIDNWGGGVDFYFTMDERDAITVADQFTGYTHPSYGDVYVNDFVEYAGTVSEGISYFDGDSTFNFNVVYYVEAGFFGYGYETFKLNGSLNPEAKAKAPAKNSVRKGLNIKPEVMTMTAPQLKRNGYFMSIELN